MKSDHSLKNCVKHKIIILSLLFGFSVPVFATPIPNCARITKIPDRVKKEMKKYTWRKSCPVPLNQLRFLKLPYWGFDNKSHCGALIINASLAKQVKKIFISLYKAHFPIERMQPMYIFKGDDELAMEHNNTSSFNCRPITGKTGVFSQHAYGRAIDINTKINPYVKGKIILPKNGKSYVNRNIPARGKITQNTYPWKLFTDAGWRWGGQWHELKDYQHFEKHTT